MKNVELGWNSFNNENISMLKNLFETNMFSDVTLVTGDKVVINAHRFILSSRSETFDNLLMRQDFDNNLTVECITSDVMMLVLEFMYTGQINMEQEKFSKFIEAAHYLKLKTEIRNLNDTQKEEPIFVKTEILEETVFDNIETDAEKLEREQISLEYDIGLPSTKEEVETPLITCDAEIKPSHVCKKCKREFKSDSKFKIHTKLCISFGSLRPFKCNDCGSAFKQKYHLNLHKKPINRCRQSPPS